MGTINGLSNQCCHGQELMAFQSSVVAIMSLNESSEGMRAAETVDVPIAGQRQQKSQRLPWENNSC